MVTAVLLPPPGHVRPIAPLQGKACSLQSQQGWGYNSTLAGQARRRQSRRNMVQGWCSKPAQPVSQGLQRVPDRLSAAPPPAPHTSAHAALPCTCGPGSSWGHQILSMPDEAWYCLLPQRSSSSQHLCWAPSPTSSSGFATSPCWHRHAQPAAAHAATKLLFTTPTGPWQDQQLS